MKTRIKSDAAWLSTLVGLLGVAVLSAETAQAAGIAQIMESKSLSGATIEMLDPRTGTSTSTGDDALAVRIDVGDIVLFKFAFTPAPGGANRGIQSYLTDYIPPNTRIVGVRITDAQGHTIEPRYPGLSEYGCEGAGCTSFADLPCTIGSSGCGDGLISLSRGSIAQAHADTGIFYASTTDSRLNRDPAAQLIALGNGITMSSEPVFVGPIKNLLGIGMAEPVFAHNVWDWIQVQAFGTSVAAAGNTGRGETPFGYGSPVAGPQTYYRYEATEVAGNIRFDNTVGPWNRIRYPGSKIGYGPPDATGNDPATGQPYVRLIRDPVGGEIGWDVTPANPLNANALRWAMGDARVGAPQFVEVALEVLALPLDPNFGDTNGHTNCGEVVSSHPATRRNGSVSYGNENPWSSYLASPSCTNLRLLLDVTGDPDPAILSDVWLTLHAKNLSINDESGVIIEFRWDGTHLDYVSSDAGPAPDGPPSVCTDDSNKTCLRWSIGILAASDEIDISTTYWAKNSPGTGALTVRYYSNEWTDPGYYETRDAYVHELVAAPTVFLTPIADPTTTPAIANGTYALQGSLINVGNAAGAFAEFNPRLPAGWSLVGNQLIIGGVSVACNVAAPDAPNRPRCAYTSSFTAGEQRSFDMTVNIPSGAATGLYDLDLQVWMDSVETYFNRVVTVPVGSPRTPRPILDCPIGSTSEFITGTASGSAEVTLYFNLMERGFTTSDDAGVWAINDFDYFAPFGRLYGGLEVNATAQAAGRLPSEYSDRCVVTPDCPFGEPVEQTCHDGIDNDCDGNVDCADSDCDEDAICLPEPTAWLAQSAGILLLCVLHRSRTRKRS